VNAQLWLGEVLYHPVRKEICLYSYVYRLSSEVKDLAFFANSGLVSEGKDLGYKGLKASTDQLMKQTFGEEKKTMQIKDQSN
jgi:hypothetical protein